MAGMFLHSRTANRRVAWLSDLHRAALVLGASGGLFWSSFAVGRLIVAIPSFGPIYMDLLLSWVAVLVHVSAWPDLWAGLRDLRARKPNDADAVLAWRAFLLTLGLVFAAAVVLPLHYHVIASTEAWLLVLYVIAFPYLPWTFVPVLALHGILFGRVANYLEPRARRVTDAGAMLLFAVAAATAALIVQNPGTTVFVRSWSVGRGLLPAAALGGYVLIALGLTVRTTSAWPRVRSWTPQRAR